MCDKLFAKPPIWNDHNVAYTSSWNPINLQLFEYTVPKLLSYLIKTLKLSDNAERNDQ